MIKVKILGINKIKKMYEQSPVIIEPVLQNAINASQAVLAKNTTRGVVPWKTGKLVQTFAFRTGRLMAEWFPTVKYAIFVEGGTRPHIIRVKNKKVLADKKTGQIFGTIVHHPGTKANKFMERIVGKSQIEIDGLFKRSLEIMVSKLV